VLKNSEEVKEVGEVVSSHPDRIFASIQDWLAAFNS